MSDQIRLQILALLLQHHKGGSPKMLEDRAISEKLGLPVQETQDQLRILHQQGYAHILETFGPSVDAEITPSGIALIEQIAQQMDEQRHKKPIGFKKG